MPGERGFYDDSRLAERISRLEGEVELHRKHVSDSFREIINRLNNIDAVLSRIEREGLRDNTYLAERVSALEEKIQVRTLVGGLAILGSVIANVKALLQ